MILTCAHDDGHSEVIMVFGSHLVPRMCFLDGTGLGQFGDAVLEIRRSVQRG